MTILKDLIVTGDSYFSGNQLNRGDIVIGKTPGNSNICSGIMLNDNTNEIAISAASSYDEYDKASGIWFSGLGSSNPVMLIRVGNGTDSSSLKGFPNGKLTWNEKVIQSVTGSIIFYGGTVPPDGYLICNGSAISRTTYSDLYGVIGTTFGSGDENSTFNLPNLIDRFPQGGTITGTVRTAGLPNITGNAYVRGFANDGNHCVQRFGAGALYESWRGASDVGTAMGSYSNPTAITMSLDASRCSSIYGNSSTVQPPSLTLLPCIKY